MSIPLMGLWIEQKSEDDEPREGYDSDGFDTIHSREDILKGYPSYCMAVRIKKRQLGWNQIHFSCNLLT